MTGRLAVLTLGVALALAVPAPSAAAGKTLELIGPAARDVRFVGGTGSAALIVRNTSMRAVKLDVQFTSYSGDIAANLTERPAGARATLLDPESVRAAVPPGGTRRIALRLRLATGQAPQDAGGTLDVRSARPGSEPVVTRLNGKPPDVRFDPARVMVDVSQGCWLVGGTCGDETTVVVRGRDAVAWARNPGGALGLAVLNNEHGGSVTIRLRRPVIKGTTVTADVDTSNLSEAGHYRGPLPLDGAALAGPALDVEVDVRWSLGAAIATVFAGALFGGFFLRRFEIRRRRRLLELELLSGLHRYDEERARSGDQVFGYDLDAVLEPRQHDQAETVPFPGTRGVSALLWHIRTASDDADFSEDVGRTHALIGNLERWLTLEPVARDTTRLLREAIPPPRGNVEFSDLQSYRDLARLRVRATTAPKDDQACEQLVASLAEQGLLVAKCKVIWALLAEIEGRGGWTVEQARTIHDLDLMTLEKQFPPLKDRAMAETDELRVLLDETDDRLRRLHGDTEASFSQRPSVLQVRDIAPGLAATKRNPGIDRKLPDVNPWRLRLNVAFNELALRSALWTLARAFVAVAAYALTVYSDTWGSVTDFASAFTVGFLTETVVNWAVLPAFRSIRNRALPASETFAGDDVELGGAQASAPDEGPGHPATTNP